MNRRLVSLEKGALIVEATRGECCWEQQRERFESYLE